MVAFYPAHLVLGLVASGVIVGGSSVPGGLQKRQNIVPGNVPDACRDACSTVESVTATCPSSQPSCLCTSSINTGIKSCYDCIFAQPGTPSPDLVQQSQLSLVAYEQACNSGGFAVASLTLSAAQNAASPTAPSNPTSSATTSSTTSSSSASSPSTTSGAGTSRSASVSAAVLVAGFVAMFV